ncbi:hypothetical protein KQI77_05655 [Clostridium sp. MSJ-8]|uniref:hypothetical protein n=1 Tax=Clostridium sp. MSJ-8 TaxID=2841510 RepID=UPI001C0EC765|nr:hypothetical protein [Clostridium sp. MSJ-8]MBU5487650.1 hypothetical protein [Clostridium sp. MSJ-8]
MYKKLNNKEWKKTVDLYYKGNKNISIKEYCIKNNLNKSQFFIIKEEFTIMNIKNQYFFVLP